MKEKIYLNEWIYNAGIVGFLRILENAEDNFCIIKNNYIEFETENLKKFGNYYFKYFMDKYDISRKIKEKTEETFNIIKLNLEKENTNAEEEKQQKERIKNQKKYIKVVIKTQLDKIKKIDEELYSQMLEKYNEIDKITNKEDILKLKEIFEYLKDCFSKENINNRLTMNLFKSILSKSYFGQQSFLNVIKTSFSLEEQKDIMYKEYISNIIEMGFIQDVLSNKYTLEQVQEYIKTEKNLRTGEIEKIYSNINKLIEKQQDLEEVKEYIKKSINSDCTMCECENVITSEYSEGNFIPLAVSSNNMKNFFWDQNVNFHICDICKLILFCIPAGITAITKTVKENGKSKDVYKEKELLSFVNYDTSVNNLYKTNNNFMAISKKDKNIYNPYEELILNIVEQDKKISEWQLNNIFIVEFEAEYLAYSRIEYFNIKRYVAKFFVQYSNISLNLIKDHRYKLQIVDYILKNKDINNIINDRIRGNLADGTLYGYNSYLATKTRLVLNLLRKDNINMSEEIEKNNKKLYVIYATGVAIHEQLKLNNEDNKLNGYTYKMLNSIKAGNKKEFMDNVIRLHMFMSKDVSPIFLEVMQDGNLDFQSIGHSFLSGLISNKYEIDSNKGVN